MRILRKMDERTEYRVRERQRVSESALLSDIFPQIKALSLNLDQYDSTGLSRLSQVKFTLNLKHARSLLRIDCANPECIRGDFDLSEPIDHAVAAHDKDVCGELCCRGWMSRNSIDQIRCGRILRYRLAITYH